MRSLSLLLVVTIGFQSLHISLEDLARLDDLIRHSQYHQKTYGDDFMTFLIKHYGQESPEHKRHHSEEKKDHDQLPFQHDLNQQIVVVFTLPSLFSLSPKSVFSWSNKGFMSNAFLYSNPVAMGVFHPPRLS